MPRFVVNRWPVNRRHEGQQSEVIEAADYGAALEAAYEATGHGVQFEVYPDPTPEPEPEPVASPVASEPVVVKPPRRRASTKKETKP